MTTNQIVTWTALPNGVTGDEPDRKLRLSVFISPRLQTSEGLSLALFPDFLDWPAQMQPNNVAFDIQVDNGPQVRAVITSPPPDSTLWQALFNFSTFVRPYQFDDFSNRPIITYPAGKIMAYLKKCYQRVATISPLNLPRNADLGGRVISEGGSYIFRDLLDLWFNLEAGSEADLTSRLLDQIDEKKQEAQERRNRYANHAIPDTDGMLLEVAPTNPDSDSSNFFQLMLFHYRPHDARPVDMPSTEEDFRQAVDFHQMLSSLEEYPELLRRLGLVVDIEIAASDIPASPTEQPRRLQVIPTWSPLLVANVNYTPWTTYVLEQNRFFLPAPRPAQSGSAEIETVLGLLNVRNPGQFEVMQVDVDGAALKAINMASTLANQTLLDERPIDAPQKSGVPSLQTGGVSLTRVGHAKTMNNGFNVAHNNNVLLESTPPQLATFFAEDLTCGYRIDVWDSRSGHWHSLNKRVGTYRFLNHQGGPLQLTVTDEGFVQLGVTQPASAKAAPPDPASEIYVHESLFRWGGWSLSAPRPGKSINRNPQAPTSDDPTTQPERVRPQAVTGFKLETGFAAEPGTLPRLRFGLNYQFRVRTVDLAGNSLSLDEADALLQFLQKQNGTILALPEEPENFIYRRFEPVNAPVLVLREKLTEGESLERLVIRSSHNASAEAYAATHPGKYQSFNERHIVPPKTSQLMTEMHGLLDASFDTHANFQQTYNIAKKEKGSFRDTSIIDIRTGAEVPISNTTVVNPQTGTSMTIPSVEFVKTGKDVQDDNGYTVHHEAQLKLPYLPDPLARGAVLRNLPGVPAGIVGQLDAGEHLVFQQSPLPAADAMTLGSITQINFGSGTNWPEMLPLRLRLVEGNEQPTWDAEARVLTIRLPKAEKATVRLSSYLLEDDLSLLGIWQWMVEWLEAQIQTPADAPAVEQRLAVLKQQAIAGAIWMLTPFRELVLVHAVQQPLEAPKILFLEPLKERNLTFAYIGGEVRVHGKSTMKLDLLASWQEPIDQIQEPAPRIFNANAHVFEVAIHLPDEATASPEIESSYTVPVATYVLEEDRVQFLAPSPDDQSGRTFSSRHEFGDTKYRRVRYQAVGTTRFREYFSPEITSDPSQISRVSTEVEVDVLNSARPAAPKVLYVLPTFGWQKPDDPTATVQIRKRLGGGLRVYLDRPWYSSGDGELLGVVLWPELNFPPIEEVQPYITQWGRDPIWQSNSTFAAPYPSNFKKSVSSASELSLDELRTVSFGGLAVISREIKVAVVAHAVNFDGKRWYCDIEIDPGESYFPFVRLALARYQPKSVEDAHLSRVVLADFAQLAPDRTVTLISEPDNPDLFNIAVAGLTYRVNAGPIPRGTSEIEVSVEQRLPGTNDELGWVSASNPAIQIQPDTGQVVGTLLWSGRVTLPSTRTPKQFRLVIKEHEVFFADKQEPTLGQPISWGVNRLDIFVVGTDRALYHKAWDGTQWLPSQNDWEPLGGAIIGSPTAVSWGVNRLDIFVVGTDQELYHKAWDGTQWLPSQNDWEPLGGAIIGSPTAVSWGVNRLDIFVVGTDQELYHKAWDGTQWLPSQNDWEPLGGAIIGSPTAVSWGVNRLDIFVVGTDQALYHKAWDGTQWLPSQNDWEPLGGAIIGSPTAVSWGVNRLDIFVVGTDQALYHKAWDGTQWLPSQNDWEPLGGAIIGSPTAVSWGVNRLDIFVVGTDQELYHKAWDGTQWLPSQNDWEPLGGAIIGSPTAVSWGVNRLDIFVVGTDRALYHKAWDGTQWLPSQNDWEPLGGAGIVPQAQRLVYAEVLEI